MARYTLRPDCSLDEARDEIEALRPDELDFSFLAYRGNQLVRLPEWLGYLTNLTTLDLSGNQFSELPESLG
ncbi:MAG: hypothetical protein ACOYEV_05565, partial [Candidatus Nanopelagicales bacterium]